VRVTAEPGALRIEAERPSVFVGAHAAVRQLEIPYGRFERRISIARLVAFLAGCGKPKRQLNVFTWSEYIDPKVVCVTGITFPMEVANLAQELFEKYGGMQKGFLRRVYRPGTAAVQSSQVHRVAGFGHQSTGNEPAQRPRRRSLDLRPSSA
jgi:hypothetical protein